MSLFGNNPQGANGEDMLKNLLDQLRQDDSVLRVQMNDQRLMKLAEYDASKGYMNAKITPDEIQARFFELKTRVKSGSFTLKALEEDVYSRWGITEESREEVILKNKETGTISKPITGFSVDDIEVAKIGKNSKKNH